jgi:hypothetical protein
VGVAVGDGGGGPLAGVGEHLLLLLLARLANGLSGEGGRDGASSSAWCCLVALEDVSDLVGASVMAEPARIRPRSRRRPVSTPVVGESLPGLRHDGELRRLYAISTK